MYLLCRRCAAQTPGWDVSARVHANPAPPPLRLLLDPELNNARLPEDPRRSAAMPSLRSVRPPDELRLLLDS